MQRTLSRFLFLTFLIIGLGVGEIVWTRLASPGCQDWQTELQRRVEAYARLHLPDQAPQVQVQASCGHASIPDALLFRWYRLAYKMGWRTQKPLDDADLRMAVTRDLMQHPDMGSLKFIVRFDASLNTETRKRVEELIERYLLVDDQRQRIEFKRVKKPAEAAAIKGSVQPALEPPVLTRPWHTPLFASPEPKIESSLIRVSNAIFAILVLCFGSVFLLNGWRLRRRPRPAKTPSTGAATPEMSAFSILFAPRVMRDLGERGRDAWRLLLQLDRNRAQRRVLSWWEKDREGLLQFLGWLDMATQESILGFLPTDHLLKLTDHLPALPLPPRDAQRAALRILLDVARELAQCSGLADAPLFVHLLTRREWQRVSQQMTRPRRRALAELLDKERATWLRARQDLHPGWFQSGAKESMANDQLVRKVRSILQVDADQLREQLYADREAIQVIDSFFADLTLDTGLNSDLAMLVLGECLHRQASFGRLIERRDVNLLSALSLCDDQQVALLLYESDPQLKALVFEALGPRRDAIEALVLVMEEDKHHSKSLRMQARSLQRFVERQVLVADLLCPESA